MLDLYEEEERAQISLMELMESVKIKEGGAEGKNDDEDDDDAAKTRTSHLADVC